MAAGAQTGKPVPGRTGRRPGNPDTRRHILQTASRLFLADGYQQTSVRRVAREAGVDQALVHRYFGSKHELFLASARLGFDPAKLIQTSPRAAPKGRGRGSSPRSLRCGTALGVRCCSPN